MRSLLIAVLVSLCLPAVTEPALAQGDLDEYQRGLAFRMLRKVRAEIEEHYFDPGFGGKNLDQLDYRAQTAIESATTRAQAFGAVAQFVADLGDSHTRFFPPGLTVEANYGWTWTVIGDDAFVTSVAPGSDAERRGLRPGDKILAIDGLRPTRENIKTIWYVYHALQPRQGMGMVVERPDGNREDLAFEAKLRRLPPEFRVTDLEHMRFFRNLGGGGGSSHRWKTMDSVALWRFDGFGFEDDRIDRYMRDARGYPWLILDLRENGGGSGEGITRLLGHFFADSFPAFTQTTRDTSMDFTVHPRGGTPYAGQVTVLMSSGSASAAEIAARVLQIKGRAMVVGDRSAGAVVGSRFLGLAERSSDHTVTYVLQLSFIDAVMPDGNRLEGVGVVPNVPALPTGADLVAGRDPAMQFALEMAGVRMNAEEAGKIWK